MTECGRFSERSEHEMCGVGAREPYAASNVTFESGSVLAGQP
jgi:hypothetical protein